MASDRHAVTSDQTPSPRSVGGRLALLRVAAALLAGVTTLVACVNVEGDPQLADVGFVGPHLSSGQSATGDKPQSKLWFHDGTWWGVLRSDGDALVISELDAVEQVWRATNLLIDERNGVRADVLWDGSSLHVVTAGEADEPSDAIRYQRLTYDPSLRAYRRLRGFPVLVEPGGSESFVVAQDSLGRSWITYTSDRAVKVTTASVDGITWNSPFTIPVSGADSITDDDIASLVSFSDGARGPSIGVMFGNQNDGSYTFAIHRDDDPLDVWRTERVLEGDQMADDHINLKAALIDGRWWIAAVLKTSLNAPDDPLILLAIRDPQGRWKSTPFGQVRDQHTRPVVLLDGEHRQVHVFASAPCCSGGRIHHKVTSLLGPQFEPGVGDVFIALRTVSGLNNPTTTKQDVDSESGLLVVAEDLGAKAYAYNLAQLGDTDIALDTTIMSRPDRVTTSRAAKIDFVSTSRSATFECRLDAGSYQPCSSPVRLGAVDVGEHSFWVRAVDRGHPEVLDTSPALVEWRRAEPLFEDRFDAGLSGWSVTRTNPAVASVVDTTGDPDTGPAAVFDSDGTARTVAAATRTFEPRRDLIVRLRARVDRPATAGSHVRLLTMSDAGESPLVYLYRQSSDVPGARDDGRIWVRLADTRFPASARLELGVWHEFTLVVAIDEMGLAHVELMLDGEPILSSSAVTLDSGELSKVTIGYPTSGQDYRITLDDVSVLA